MVRQRPSAGEPSWPGATLKGGAWLDALTDYLRGNLDLVTLRRGASARPHAIAS